MMYDAGLILEGGGMRGLYTSGVLDFFLEKNLEFKDCFGVSAGCINGMSYIAKQKKRAYDVSMNYLHDKRYASMYSLITTGNYFGYDFNLNVIPNELNPFDYETFKNSPTNFYAVVTNIVTGKAEYKKITDLKEDIDYVWASGSLPLLAKKVKINDAYYLDGGISDFIPVGASIRNGNKKNVVILTQDPNYRKKLEPQQKLISIWYHRYPKLVKAMKTRHIRYNKRISRIKEEAKKGNLFVLQPQKPVQIKRLEKDSKVLQGLYEDGYQDAKRQYDALMQYLES